MTCTTRSALSMTAAFHKRQNDIAPLLTETAIRMCWRAFELAKNGFVDFYDLSSAAQGLVV